MREKLEPYQGQIKTKTKLTKATSMESGLAKSSRKRPSSSSLAEDYFGIHKKRSNTTLPSLGEDSSVICKKRSKTSLLVEKMEAFGLERAPKKSGT